MEAKCYTNVLGPVPVCSFNSEAKNKQSSQTTELPRAPLPKTMFLGKVAPAWINRIRAELSAPGSSKGKLVSSELKNLRPEEQKQVLDWMAKKVHHQFKQDDDRYYSKESAKEVIEQRAYSGLPNETVFVSAIRYKDWFGRDRFMPVSSISLVELDSPTMLEFGKNWGADFISKRRYQGRGLATSLIQEFLKPATEKMGGFKLYSEPQNTGWYDHLGMHRIGEKDIDNKDKPGEKIRVVIFSSEKSECSSGTIE